MLPTRTLLTTVAAALCAALLAACGGDDPSSKAPRALDTVAASPAVKAAWASQQELLRGPLPAAPRQADLLLFYHLRNTLSDPDRRAAAVDRLLQLLTEDPGNPLWIELAVTKKRFIPDREKLDGLLAAVAGPDTAAAIFFFVDARRHWGDKRRATEGFRRASELAAEGSLLRFWSRLRHARLLFDSGERSAVIANMIALLPEAWSLGGPPLAGTVWQDLSYVTRKVGRLGDALLAARAAEACADALDHGFLRTRARLAIGRAHMARREYAAAMDTFRSCRQVAQDSGYYRWSKDATGLLSIAAAECGDPLLQRTNLLDVHRTVEFMADTNGIVLTRVVLSNVELDLGRIDVAEEWLVRAREADDAWAGGQRRADVDRAMATLRDQQGRYAEAESLRVASGVGQILDPHGLRALSTQLGLLGQGLKTGRPDLAYRALKAARALQPATMPRTATYDPVLRVELAAAEFHAQQGEHHLAQASLAEALSRREAALPAAQWSVDATEGVVAREAQDLRTARRAFASCEEIAQALGDPDLIRRSRLYLGSTLLEDGAFAAAESLFATGRDAPEYWNRLHAHLLTGMSRSRNGEPEAALVAFAAVDSLLGPDAPRDVLARVRLEEGRALAALDRPSDALARLGEARRRLTGPRGRLRSDVDASFNAAIERETAQATLALLHDHPRLAEGEPAAVTRAVASWGRNGGGGPSARAGSGDTRVEYFVGDSHAFVWVIPAGGGPPTWRALPTPGELAELVDAVTVDMSYPGREVDGRAAAALGRHLLGPVLATWAPGATLEILADGFLAGVPWAALPLPLPSPEPAVDRGPLVLVTESGAGAAPDSRATGLLVLGANGSADGTEVRTLVHAEDEARRVADVWPGAVNLCLGEDSCWPEVRAGGARGYRAIHIASHARVYEGTGGRSAIHIAGLDAATPLTLAEIPVLGADAEVIYLSSCEGARHHRASGHGVTSFADAFLGAGAQAVVASSILVDDEAASVLAEAFYRHWLAGEDKATALRAAVREVRALEPRWAHPFFWAFVGLYRTAT